MNPECLNLDRFQQGRLGKVRREKGEEVAWKGPERDHPRGWLGREKEGGGGGGRRRETWRIRRRNMKGTWMAGKAGAPGREKQRNKLHMRVFLRSGKRVFFILVHPRPDTGPGPYSKHQGRGDSQRSMQESPRGKQGGRRWFQLKIGCRPLKDARVNKLEGK